MDARTRLLRVLRRQPVDRPPLICPGGMMTMAVTEVMDRLGVGWPEAHVQAEGMANLSAAMAELGGLENAGVPYCMTIEAEAMGAQVDLGTRDGEPRVTAYAADDTVQAARLPRMDPTAGRAEVCLRAVQRLAECKLGVPIIANVVGPISLATSLVDPLRFYRDLRKDPAAAKALVDLVTESAAAFGEALIDAGADVLCIADPSGTGELIGGAAFERLALPALNALVDRFARKGAPTIVHICGRIEAIHRPIGALNAAAVSVDSCVSLASLREAAQGKPVMGNVSTFKLQKGRPEEVTRAAQSCLRQGVDILAPACGLSARTPLENVRSLAAAVQPTEARAVGGGA